MKERHGEVLCSEVSQRERFLSHLGSLRRYVRMCMRVRVYLADLAIKT